MIIRQTKHEDIADLQQVLDGTELFPSALLPDMLGGFLANEVSTDIWLTCESDSTAVGFCYAAQEELTDGTWNMRAIAVLPEKQGKGCGAETVKSLEDALRQRGHRVVIVDTSSAADFADTRKFYRKNGYTEEARVRDFWASGDDKIVFWKALT